MNSDYIIMAVIGNPVLHSLSPVLMKRAMKDNNLQGSYLRLPVDKIEQAIWVFKNLPLRAMNVTAPFKKDIIPYIDILTPNAQKAEAVNCVFRNNEGKIIGDNTDITGVELTLKKFPQHIAAGKMLILGSGGATPAVIIAGQNLNLKITVAARNIEALNNLKQRFNVDTMTYDNIEAKVNDYKIIVSALPSGVKIFNPEILNRDCTVLDANYAHSIFEQAQKQTGFNFVSGKNWLVNQAVPAFSHFTNHEANTDNLYKALEENNFKYQKRIALSGFMGVGKTTCGKKLAKKLGYKFIDLDDEIERIEQMKIKEIFAQKGESYFRNMEQKILNDLANQTEVVLALGGGTILKEQNRKVLKNNFVNLWLYASAKFCIEGLDISTRPLLQCVNPLAVAEEMLNKRLPCYADGGFGIIYAQELTFDQITQFIYEQIKKTFGI